MASLEGMIDAAVLKELQGSYNVTVPAVEEESTAAVEAWSSESWVKNQSEEVANPAYCEECGEECPALEEDAPEEEEQLCSHCSDRAHSHVVGRFMATRWSEDEDYNY